MLCEAPCTLPTEAGMHALWAPEPFAGVHDHDTWTTELGKNAAIRRHVAAGNLVPINIGSAGAATFIVRVGDRVAPARLSERETRYLLTSSQPYLLATRGRAFLSGIEHIAAETGSRTHAVHMAEGRYAVTVHLIDWKAEPDATHDDGTPADGALPDYVILIDPAEHTTRYRENLTTFGPLS